MSKLYYLSDQTGKPVDTFLFLIDAMKGTGAVVAPGGVPNHVRARQFCNAVRDYAIEQAGGESQARKLLEEMGILRSEEVGALVYAMAEVGLFAISEHDSPEDFDGLSGVLNPEKSTG